MRGNFWWILNGCFGLIFLALFFQPGLLSYFKKGKLWLTWLAIGTITLMDELSSIFYAPGEAFRYIGMGAILFIPITGIFIRYLTTRMVEIAEILEAHDLRGGGVYNFSYMVLGPLVSFVAVGSILVDYVLTAAISTVSAVENASYFLSLSSFSKIVAEVALIWLLAGLNILGIRTNARTVFAILLITALVLLNLILGGIFQMDAPNWMNIKQAAFTSKDFITASGITDSFIFFIAGISSCILAYSGVESVLQTAALAENWRAIRKGYVYLALTVGIITPLISVLVLSSPNIDFAQHETDLITHFSTIIHGEMFGMIMSILASLVLLLAMNTAFVAIGELTERVAHRYGFHWLLKTNKKASLYRVHIGSAIFFSAIVVFTNGQQKPLAEMYAVGLVASFLINMASLLIYRYLMGTKEVRAYNVSRAGTIFLFIILLSVFIYLSYHKPVGFFLWFFVTIGALLVGFYGTRKRTPELKEIIRGEKPMDILLYIAESNKKNVHVYFKRPFEKPQEKDYDLTVYLTFYSPRQTIPPKLAENHFRIPYKRASIYNNIVAILHLLVYELQDRNITVYLGWPTSSWFDRIATGVMTFQVLQLPKLFPNLNFRIEKFKLDLEK